MQLRFEGNQESRRPRSRQTYQHKNRGISEEALARLMEIIEPDHPDSPFEDKRAAVRNKIAILSPRGTGMRRGELLGLLPLHPGIEDGEPWGIVGVNRSALVVLVPDC